MILMKTHIQIKMKKILEYLNVNEAEEVAQKLADGLGYLDFYNLYDNNLEIQSSGARDVTTLKYGDEVFNFIKFKEGNSISYNLYQNDDVDKIPQCIIININLKQKIAYINGISYHENCFNVNSVRKSGSTLLKVSLKLLKMIKHKYDLTHVCLKDNSHIYCDGNTKYEIELSSLKMLISGETWYTSYGFIPYNVNKNCVDQEKYNFYLKNKKIIENTQIKNTNIKKIITNALIKLGSSVDINKMAEYYDNKNIKTFFKHFLSKNKKDYKKRCIAFSMTYKKIMENIGVVSLHGISYFMQL